MTFSAVAYSDNEWGIGVASKFLAVGAFVPWLKPGAGAIATQALANLRYGPIGLSLLEKHGAEEALRKLLEGDPLRERRQVGLVDAKGNAAAFTGRECYPHASHVVGNGYSVQGNILAGGEVLEAMAKEMESKAPLHERLMRALEAGDAKGGDRRGRQSAAIIIARSPDDSIAETHPSSIGRILDIRVDNDDFPLPKLRAMLDEWSAMFFEEEMLEAAAYENEINEALRRLGYRDLRAWVEENNFENKYDGKRIGKNVLRILLRRAGLAQSQPQ